MDHFHLKIRAVDAQENCGHFANGSSLAMDAVVWTIRFRPYYWVRAQLPLFDVAGIAQHHLG